MDEVDVDRSLLTHGGGGGHAGEEDGPSPLVGKGVDVGQQELQGLSADELPVL